MAQQQAIDSEKEEKYANDATSDNPKAMKRLSLEGQLKAARISLEQQINPKILNKDKLIPKKILKNAKGIVFLTCIKAGFLFAGNIGTGCVIVRNHENNGNNTLTGWSPPSSIGVAGLSFGFLAGGAKVDYVFILNDDFAVKQFTGAGQLRLGGEVQLALGLFMLIHDHYMMHNHMIYIFYLGPIGRDADASLGVGDGGVSAIYSYSHTQGLYGGLEMKGKIISVRPKCNEKFYNVKNVKCKDILAGKYRMPKNRDYERIVHLLNTYCLDHAFPQIIEETVDIDAMMNLNDVNIENAVNTLHSVFSDVDKEVIRIILMEQCWGDMDHATDILLKMSKANTSKHKVDAKIEEHDTDVVRNEANIKEMQEIADKVKESVIKQGEIQNIAKFDCYQVVKGRCISRAVESYQVEMKTTDSNKKVESVETVVDMKYRIKVKVGDNRICELLIYKSNPPLKYQLLNAEFGLEQHADEEKQATTQPTLSPFSSNELRKLARKTTKKHLELSDDDIDYEENCPIVSTINANTMSSKGNNDSGNNNSGNNGQQTVAMLDGLVNSFEKVKHV